MTLNKTEQDDDVFMATAPETTLETVPVQTAASAPAIPLKHPTLRLSWAKTDRAGFARRPAVRLRVNAARVNWEMMGFVVLMAALMAFCLYRVVWALQL